MVFPGKFSFRQNTANGSSGSVHVSRWIITFVYTSASCKFGLRLLWTIQSECSLNVAAVPKKQKHQILAADDLTMIKYLYGSARVTTQNAWWCITDYETCKAWWKWPQCEQERVLSKWTVYLLMSISSLSWWRLYRSCSETPVQGNMSTHVLKLVSSYPSAWQRTDLQLKSCLTFYCLAFESKSMVPAAYKQKPHTWTSY